MRIAVVGGNVAALLASYQLQRHGADVLCFHRGGGLGDDLLRRPETMFASDALVSVVNKLRLPYSRYRSRTGLLLSGGLRGYYDHLRRCHKRESDIIRRNIYQKSRVIIQDKVKISDEVPSSKREAVSFDQVDFLKAMREPVRVCSRQITDVSAGKIRTPDGIYLFDAIVVTKPLWELRNVVRWGLPETTAVALNVTTVMPNGTDPYLGYDNVFTPYTPGGAVHRLYQHEGGYRLLWTSRCDLGNLTSDLNYLFKDGWYIRETLSGIEGYIYPADNLPAWPRGIVPLGRFATWNQKDGLDVVAEQVSRLTRAWK